MYLTAAAELLTMAGIGRASDLEDRHARVYLMRKCGHRASLARFAAWLPTIGGPVASARRTPHAEPAAAGKGRAQGCAQADRGARGGAGSLAGQGVARRDPSPSVLFSLSRVLALARTEAVESDGDVVLWSDGPALRLVPGLAAVFRRFGASDGTLAFPGRNGAQPLSTTAVRHHCGRQTGRPRKERSA